MKKYHESLKQHGFTLIELVAVLILVGMLASVAGFGIVTGVRGYLMATENANITQKAQLVMTRLSREIIECRDCDGLVGAITLPFQYSNTIGNRELNFNSGQLNLGSQGGDPYPLADQVNTFALSRRDDRRIRITLVMQHQHGDTNITFETSIFPRNTYL